MPSRALHRCPRHPCLTAIEVLKRRHHKSAHLSSSAELPHKRQSTSPTICHRPSPRDRLSRALHRCPRHPCLTAIEMLERRHHKGAHLSSSAEFPHKRPSTSPTICYRPSPHSRLSRALHRCPRHPCIMAIKVLKQWYHKGVLLSSSAEL